MKTQEIITNDLSQFGYRELKIAARLLTAYCDDSGKNKVRFLDDGVSVWMNRNSGNVFLCDENNNVAMLNGDILEDWFSCPICGHEGFLEDMYHEENNECQEYLKSIRE